MTIITEGYLQYRREIFMDFDEMLKDELWEDLSKEQLIAFFKKSLEVDNTEFYYYFDTQFCTASRLGFENVFFLKDLQNLVNHSFSTDNLGVKKYQEIQWNTKFLNNENWNVQYEFEIDKNDKKSILGYDCFKAIVKQIRYFNGEVDYIIYELYVTDKIKLPARIITGWWDTVINLCPLEIIDYKEGNKKQTYSKTEIQVIEGKNVKNELRIPDDYRHLVKEGVLAGY
jgi:hypothetical protein